MIDIVKLVQAKNPALGAYVLVLRADSRALAAPDRLTEEAAAWMEARTPGARLVRESVLLAPFPGGVPAERTVSVLAFRDAQQLAAFATTWTGDSETEA
ncbi:MULTISPECIES: hypothetical protein [Methylobacterium]|uniref:DUF1330 domain-containing protein n=1 Tax=Methylobacterium jeotgali TaxID=381630 RepID=A0ABQ4SZ62_9HYPH|nr:MULTISPECIES: hypothetical protein [Methylobacterium]PIU06156.1 MAG: hypothetical protein COT56_11180 [Methylobacterium sp. CG09_land_8_20_14_0_10_71_15]PIU12026.1 MAG: hypothetical protein COT28_16980 [Methylobacterium sp. CG08_land_8_20_14_0_20_71_15]GBU20006.1 hypothetical protein AwMethylo_42210 [Methylobacterium sp.]GJE07795.1 hypothetical protein AOPFMNJM_3125 [Methylobacterium jeotgali]